MRVLDATFIVVPEAGAAGSVGTAVALGDGTFVTAAHVLNGIIGSRYTQPFLYHAPARYGIQEIVRYSQDEDVGILVEQDADAAANEAGTRNRLAGRKSHDLQRAARWRAPSAPQDRHAGDTRHTVLRRYRRE